MTTDIDKLAQQMREAAGKASPGPWRVVTDYPALAIGAGDYRVVQTPNQNNLRRFGPANNWDGIPSEANAAYIALANPANIVALLDDRERLREALGQLRKSATLLQQNAEGCAVNHYGEDFAIQGLPGWLADTAADIGRATAALATSGGGNG